MLRAVTEMQQYAASFFDRGVQNNPVYADNVNGEFLLLCA